MSKPPQCANCMAQCTHCTGQIVFPDGADAPPVPSFGFDPAQGFQTPDMSKVMISTGGAETTSWVGSKQCVKCRYNKIKGPKYIGKESYVPMSECDKLKYVCERCGYHWFEDCADKAPNP